MAETGSRHEQLWVMSRVVASIHEMRDIECNKPITQCFAVCDQSFANILFEQVLTVFCWSHDTDRFVLNPDWVSWKTKIEKDGYPSCRRVVGWISSWEMLGRRGLDWFHKRAVYYKNLLD